MSVQDSSTINQKFINIADTIPPEYILEMPFTDKKTGQKSVQKFIRFGGLLYLMDNLGIYRVQTSCINWKPTEVRYEAKVFLCPSSEYLAYKGITSDNPCISLLMEPTVMHATATHDNTSSMMLKFLEPLAETRAIARAFRLVTGCPFTAVDELDKRDFKNISDETGISIESLEDMMIKEQAKTISKSDVVSSNAKPTSRANTLTFLKSMINTHAGVKEYINNVLDNNNALVLENLPDSVLFDVHKEVIELIGD